MAGRITSASIKAVVGRKKSIKAALTLVRVSIEFNSILNATYELNLLCYIYICV